MANIDICYLKPHEHSVNGCAELSNRQRTKLNIFLNSLSHTLITNNGSSIIVTHLVGDTHIIAQTIEKVVRFFEKQGCSVSFDDAITMLLQKNEERRQENQSIHDKLVAARVTPEDQQLDFREFCSFCDSALRINLRPYQYHAAFLLSIGKGGFDFSVPGAGKTIISYAAYAHLKSRGVVEKIFIIGPGSSYHAWFDEYVTCFGEVPLFENLSDMSTKDCRAYLNASSKNHQEISFINMEKVRLLTRDIVACVASGKYLLIIDEAHKIKSPKAAVTKAALEITKHVQARVILTGTPMPNGYEDLHTLTQVFSPFESILPYSHSQLKSFTKDSASTAQVQTIHSSLKPYYSRISKKYLLETKELLPPIFHIVRCDMADEQRMLYQRLNEFYGKIKDGVDEDILMMLKKAMLIRKMQISANPALLRRSLIDSMDELRIEYSEGGNEKQTEIEDLVMADKELMKGFSESAIARIVNSYHNGSSLSSKNIQAVELAKKLIDVGEKVLIWDVFVLNMDALKEMLEAYLGTAVEVVNGSVTGIERQAAIKRFREGESKILLANPATLAESISLHKVCQNAIYVNRNFNAAQFMQSKDRIHRINMPSGKTARYYFLINDDSIDESIDERLSQKEQRMLAILDADDIEVGGEELEDSSIMSVQDIETSYLR